MTEVLLLASLPVYLRNDISAGVSRTICPKCDGGRSRERSLSIRPKDDCALVKLSCFRASCDWWAVTMTDPDATLQHAPTKVAAVYRNEIYPISISLARRLACRYGLDRSTWRGHGWGMSEPGHALVLPIRGPYGGERGHVTRTFDSPKRVYTYKATAQPWLDWWCGDADKPFVVVEDCLSACRLSGLGYCAISLLGTGISVEQAKEIAKIYSDRVEAVKVYLALDRDAYVKSLKLVARHAHILTMLPICLTEDIKNMDNDDDIRALFGGE